MFYSSAAPGRHKIISKLSIMFNTILTWPLITIQYRYAFLDTFYDCDFSDKKSQEFPPIRKEMKILVFRLGFPDMGWSILIWKWNKDWVIDLNLKFWLPSRVSTLNTNFTSHQFNIIEISLSGKWIRIFEAKICFSEKRDAEKKSPKIESETTKNKFPKVVSEISERLFDFRIRNMNAEEINQ